MPDLREAPIWLRWLDAPAADLSDALEAVGIRRRLVVPRDLSMIYVPVAKGGFELVFTSADLCPGHEARRPTAAVLTGMRLPLDTYRGRMLLGVRRRDGRASLRARLGRPRREADRDRWTRRGLSVEVAYTEDLRAIREMLVSLP